MWWSRWLRAAIGPIVSGLQSLPSVAWVPAAIIWFGLSNAAIYAVVLLGAVPSIANGLLGGMKQVPPLFDRVGRVLGLSTLARTRYVLLPAALPGYLGGLRQGWAFAWRSLMAAELITYSPDLGQGLGQLLDVGRELSQMSLVITAIVPDPRRGHGDRAAALRSDRAAGTEPPRAHDPLSGQTGGSDGGTSPSCRSGRTRTYRSGCRNTPACRAASALISTTTSGRTRVNGTESRPPPKRPVPIRSGHGWSSAGVRTAASSADCAGDSGLVRPTTTSSPSRYRPATSWLGRSIGPITPPASTSVVSHDFTLSHSRRPGAYRVPAPLATMPLDAGRPGNR